MNLKKYYILFFILLGCLSFAQVSFEAISETNQARVGQDIAINFVITLKEQAEVGSIEYPSFNNFKVMGRTRSHQLSITNGDKTIQEIETVILRPEKKGKIRIGKAQVRIDNTTYQTKEITIQVVETPKTNIKENENRFVFLDVDVSRNATYINQPLYATVKLYAKSYDALRKRTEVEVPDLSNFQVRPILDKGNDFRDIEQEMIGGQVYVSEVVGRYVLVPQRYGALTLPSFYLKVAVPIDFFDEKVIELNTPIRTIKVKRLPENAPKSFHGAVGDFALHTEVSPQNLEENRAFNVKVELSGEGNLSYVEMPKLKLNNDLEVYKPRRQNRINQEDSIQRGEVVDSYTVVPQYGGDYQIPAIEFSYFDPQQEKYVTISSRQITLDIKGAKKEVNDSIVKDSITQPIVKKDSLNEDANNVIDTLLSFTKGTGRNIQKIEHKSERLISKETNGFKWFYSIPIVALFLGFIFFLFKRKTKTEKCKDDLKEVVLVTKKDLELQLKSLKNRKDKSSYYQGVEDLLQNIITFFAKEKSLKSEEESYAILKQNKNQSFADKWKETYQLLQQIRYGLGGEVERDEIYAACEGLIKQI